MDKMNGEVQLFLYQTISVMIFHLIFKMLLFFRHIALNYVKQMVKYRFGVNLVCCTDDS